MLSTDSDSVFTTGQTLSTPETVPLEVPAAPTSAVDTPQLPQIVVKEEAVEESADLEKREEGGEMVRREVDHARNML